MGVTRRWGIRAVMVPLGVAVLLGTGLTACSSGSSTNCVNRFQHDTHKGYKLISTSKCQSRSLGAAYYYHSYAKKGWVTGGTFTRPTSGSGHGYSHSHVSKHTSHSSGGSGGSSVRKKRH